MGKKGRGGTIASSSCDSTTKRKNRLKRKEKRLLILEEKKEILIKTQTGRGISERLEERQSICGTSAKKIKKRGVLIRRFHI